MTSTTQNQIYLDQSLSGAAWHMQSSVLNSDETERRAQGLASVTQMPPGLCCHVIRQGITQDSFDQFLEPRLRNALPDPLVLKDADRAISLIADYIEASRPIGLFGDYDVDGACAAAIIKQVCEHYGSAVYCHIPDRFSEGYGPNDAALQKLQAQGAELILTVDCGITAHQPLAAVTERGLPVIVIDHHKAGPQLPTAHAVVNPNRLDDDSSLGGLCAAALCFMVMAGVVRECRTRGITPQSGAEPDLMSLLDMVALATVCDVMPLIGLNRVFVKQGLKILARRSNTGLKTLMDIARLSQPPSAHTLGFVLGPRLNAGGRLGYSDLGVQLLCARDDDIAASISLRLDELNAERQKTEADIRRLAELQAEQQLEQQPDRKALVLSGSGWHEGVIGIVASRIKDRFNRPTIVISFNDDGQGKGSGRSISGFSLGDTVLAAKQHGLLSSGGGHDMAAGLGLTQDRLDAFTAFVEDRAGAAFSGAVPQKIHRVCSEVATAGLDISFVSWLEKLSPFGSGHAEPRFVIPYCQLKSLRWIGSEKQHLSVRLDDGTGPALNAICFSVAGTPLGQYLSEQGPSGRFSVLGRPARDSYRGGEAVQFMIDDSAVETRR